MKRSALLIAATLFAAVVALPAIAATPEATYFDTFTAQSFSGNDGDMDFAGPWKEINESNGPTVGYVWVWPHAYCDGEFCLMMGGIDKEAAGTGISRAVDLSEATSAKLSFDYGRELLQEVSGGTGVVQVSSNGGDSWSTVKTVALDADDAELARHAEVAITDWATADTVIRFKITEAETLEAYWLIDNIAIVASFEPETTTTTTPPSSTTSSSTSTSTSTSTTTTVPKSTTTTTSKPRATTTTTTTRPPDTTTTTEPERAREVPPTTTTVPPTTTTTLPPELGSGVSDEHHDTMMEKTGLAVVSAAPPMAMPALAVSGDGDRASHAEPVEALAAAFFTDSGNYGGNLFPSIALGVVIAVVTLLGIGSRRQD